MGKESGSFQKIMKPPTTCPMIPPRGSKSDDSYRDGDADPRDAFHNCKRIRGSKSDDSYRDGDADPRDPSDCLFIIATRVQK